MLRRIQHWGDGCGIAIRGGDLVVVAARMRPSGVQVLGRTSIRGFRKRPPADWGAEYSAFLGKLGLGHLAATLCLPRDEVIVRTLWLPAMRASELAGAIELLLDELHPYGDAEVYRAAAPLDRHPTPTGQRQVAAVIAEADRIDGYAEQFAQAGIALASCTLSAAALHAAVRLRPSEPQRPFLIADCHGSRLELYGESEASPVWTSALDLGGVTLEGALRLAYEDLRLPAGESAGLLLVGEAEAGATPAGFLLQSPDELLPPPVRSAEGFALRRDALALAAAIESARPGASLGLNLLPAQLRRSNAVLPYAPTIALGLALSLLGLAFLVRPTLQDRDYAAMLERAASRLERIADKVAGGTEVSEELRQRLHSMLRLQARTESDLALLRELSEILPLSAWLTSLKLDDNGATLTGTAEDADRLLAILDTTSLLDGARFTRSPSIVENGERFQVQARRRPWTAPNGPNRTPEEAGDAGETIR